MRIAAPASLRISIEGAGGHAGGVLMPDRKDALCAAAELILAIESAARSSGAPDTVATVGVCEVFPGAVNSIPSRVHLTLDIRDTDQARRDRVMQTIERASQNISTKRQVSIQSELLNADAPADCAPEVRKAISESCREHGFPFLATRLRNRLPNLRSAICRRIGVEQFRLNRDLALGGNILRYTLDRLDHAIAPCLIGVANVEG